MDTRLGCLEPNLDPKSEPQQIINAAKYALRNVATLELKFPIWRYIPTPLWTKYVNNMNYFVEICMKYIQSATEKMKTMTPAEKAAQGEPSLLERVITSEKNEKIACIMALDLILVGIDTVCAYLMSFIRAKNNCEYFILDIYGRMFYTISISNSTRRTGKTLSRIKKSYTKSRYTAVNSIVRSMSLFKSIY